MKHTLVCTKMALENKSWFDKWPKACKHCGGVGSWQTPAMGWNPPDGGPCPKCTEEGQCPRCGEDLILMNKVTYDGVDVKYDPCDYGLCTHCGWNEYLVVNHYDVAHDLSMVIPHLDHECECWMQDEPGMDVKIQEQLLADFEHNPDPVDQDPDSGLWFYWDETWSHQIGAYATEEECREQLRIYCVFLDGGYILRYWSKLLNEVLVPHYVREYNYRWTRSGNDIEILSFGIGGKEC